MICTHDLDAALKRCRICGATAEEIHRGEIASQPRWMPFRGGHNEVVWPLLRRLATRE